MSKITVTTIAGQTSGADANTVKIESGDTLAVQTNATVGGTLGVTGTSTLSGALNMSSSHIQFSGNVSLPNVGAALFRPAADTIAFGINNGQRVSVNQHGLLFGTDTVAANALDDYEEGDWTPAWANGSGQTYNSRVGRYTKIGNLVTVSCNIVTSSMNSQTGDAHVGGLPYPVVSLTNYTAVGNLNGDNQWDTNLSTQNLVVLASNGQSILRPRYNSGINTSDVRLEHIGGGNSYFSTTVTYHTD